MDRMVLARLLVPRRPQRLQHALVPDWRNAARLHARRVRNPPLRLHARRTVGIRMTLFTAVWLFWHCGDHTANPTSAGQSRFLIIKFGCFLRRVDTQICGYAVTYA